MVITLGKDGACVGELVNGQNHFIHIPTIAVEAIDTTAAGDAFIGALATYLSEYQSLQTLAARHVLPARWQPQS